MLFRSDGVRATLKIRENNPLPIIILSAKSEDADKIMDLLDSYSGVLPFTEKADPEVIRRETGMSKNEFKRAVGNLYKNGKVSITDGRIRKL